jgi:hypothetical protein
MEERIIVMTKRKLTPQQQLRNEVDKIATQIIERAQAMIQQDVPVVLAFRLAISYQLEQQYYIGQLEATMLYAKMLKGHEDV